MSNLLQNILFYVVAYSLAIFYAWLLALSYLFRWIMRPSAKFWYKKQRDVPPACLNDPTLGLHSYVQLKDVKLHYVEKGDRTKPLMLFVHGFPEFWYSWRFQTREFSKDYWTVAIDMRGYGDSDKPQGQGAYDISLLVDDLRQLITALGHEKCFLVAHDWGGVVAWEFLATHPNMVHRYIIMDAPYSQLYAKLVKSSIEQFLKSWYVFFFQLPCMPEMFVSSYDFAGLAKMFRGDKGDASSITKDDIEAFKYTFGKSGALTGPINYYRKNIGMMIGTREGMKQRLDDVPPGLLIFGEEDKYLHSGFVSLTKDFVSNLQSEVIPKANHFVQQDEPYAVNKAMQKFLDQTAN